MAGILNEFLPNTKMLSSKVNENFSIVQDDIIELGQAINSNFTQQLVSVKNDLLTDIEEISDSKASKDLSDVEPSTVFKDLILDMVSPNYSAGYSVGNGFVAPSAGWISISGYSDAGGNNPSAYIDGKRVFSNEQGAGDDRAGGLTITSTAFIGKGQKLTTGGRGTSNIFYPCKGA